MLIDNLQELNESRFEKGRGSKAGREKFASKKGTKGTSVKARKSRVKVYATIEAALDSGAPYGTIFSTKSADRLYVITKPTWGDKSRAGGNTRIAKGFTPGSATPAANWPSVKGYAVRTMLKHGKTKSKRLTAKYGPGKSRPEEKRFAGKKVTTKKKLKEAHCPAKSGKLAELLPLLALLKRTLLKKDHTEYEGPSLAEAEEWTKEDEANLALHKARGTTAFRGEPSAAEKAQIMAATKKIRMEKRVAGGAERDVRAAGYGQAKVRTPVGSVVRQGGKDVRRKGEDASTEYEGPSLSEIEGSEDSDEWFKIFNEKLKKKEKEEKEEARKGQGEGLGDQLVKREKAIRRATRDHTEYVGPSLAEQAQYINEILPLIAGAGALAGKLVGGIAAGAGRVAAGAGRLAAGAARGAGRVVRGVGRAVRGTARDVAGGVAQGVEDARLQRQQATQQHEDVGTALAVGLGGRALYDLGKAGYKRLRRKKPAIKVYDAPPPELASTEYEGPSLSEQIKYLQWVLEAYPQTKGTPEQEKKAPSLPHKMWAAKNPNTPVKKETAGTPTTPPARGPAKTATTGMEVKPTITYGGGGTHAASPAKEPAKEKAAEDGGASLRGYPRLGGRLRAPLAAWGDVGSVLKKIMKGATHMAQTWPHAPGTGASRQAASTEYEGPSIKEKLIYLGEARPMMPGRQQYAPRVRPIPQATFTTANTSQTSNVQGDIRRYNIGAGQQATVQSQELMRKRFATSPTQTRGHGTSVEGYRAPVTRTYKQRLGAGTEYEGPSLREKIKYLAEEGEEMTNIERREALKKRYEQFKKERERLDVTGQEHESKPDIAPVDLPLKGKDRKRPK